MIAGMTHGIEGAVASEVPDVHDAPPSAVAELLQRAWRAWEAGDGDALLALLAQARATGEMDADSRAWADEAETVAREQADNSRYHRTISLLRERQLRPALETWTALSAGARAAIRDTFDLPIFGWLTELNAVALDAALALAEAGEHLDAGERGMARAAIAPFRAVLDSSAATRAVLAEIDAPTPAPTVPVADPPPSPQPIEVAAPPAPTPPPTEAPASTPTPPADPEVVLAAVPAPRPAPVPASPDAIAALASHIAAGGNFKAPKSTGDWALPLALALRDLIPGRDPLVDVDRVSRVVEGRDGWKAMPATVVVRLLELVAARLHALQDAGLTDRRLGHGFSALSAWSKREQPGFAYGLMRDHRPKSGSWEADADAALDALYRCLPNEERPTPQTGKRLARLESLVSERMTCPAEVIDAVSAQIRTEVSALLAEGVSARHTRLARILAPVHELLTGPDMRVLRKAAREAAQEEEADADDSASPPAPIAADWAWWSATRGKRAVMVGGDPREPNRVRLEQAFGFKELAWEQAEGSRNSLQKVRDRVRAGGVDLVFILTRFVGHDADQVILPACKEAGVLFVPVQTGYGVAGFQRAIERFSGSGAA